MTFAGLIAVFSMTLLWKPMAAEELTPINEDNLNPNAAHVCQLTMNETYTQLESYIMYGREKTYTWCLSFNPRCTEYRIYSRTSYRIANKVRQRKKYYCCDGYKATQGLSYCTPRCDEDCYSSLGHGFCILPGLCKCNPGFHGRNCGSKCPDGQWGPDCSQSCGCSDHGSCDPENGNCVCHIGFTGQDCSRPCTDSFGLHCVHPCVCENNATCNSINGKCTCRAGFYGAYCHKECDPTTQGESSCPQTCPCQNGGSCDSVTGDCTCLPGYKGAYCAEECDRYHWGPGCTQVCECGNGKCNASTGQCVCPLGVGGNRCEIQCPSGYYGNKCEIECMCQNGGRCQHDTRRQVICDCTGTGYHGNICNDRDCAEQQFLVSGTCQDCACNWTNSKDCHATNGMCMCKPGYRDSRCESMCQMPYYGQDCREECLCPHGDCDPVTGVCTVCYPGYFSDNCDTECPADKWGSNCANKCLCKNAAVCHKTTGFCECKPGFQGTYCDEPCMDGYYGGNCLKPCSCNPQTSTCDPFDGRCLCRPGFRGSNCDKTCEEGRYGFMCRQTCKCDSAGSQGCDPITGSCICRSGWAGVKCNSRCPSHRWGEDCGQDCQCNGRGSCDPRTGECVCYPGYQGYSCEETCDSGFYGYNCAQRCPKCPGSTVCNFQTGECLQDECNSGFRGQDCRLPCPQGSWGPACRLRCSDVCDVRYSVGCDPVQGMPCICDDRHEGPTCSFEIGYGVFSNRKSEEVTEEKNLMGPLIAVVSIAGLLLIALIILIVLFYRRKVRRLKEEAYRVRYEANGHANGHAGEQTPVQNGNAVGVANPMYREQNLNNDLRYPNLTQRTALPRPRRQQARSSDDDDDDFDDIAAEKLRVSLGPNENSGCNDDDDGRYTTLKSLRSDCEGGAMAAGNDYNVNKQSYQDKLTDKTIGFTGPKVPNQEQGSRPSTNQEQGNASYSNHTYGIKPSNIVLARSPGNESLPSLSALPSDSQSSTTAVDTRSTTENTYDLPTVSNMTMTTDRSNNGNPLDHSQHTEKRDTLYDLPESWNNVDNDLARPIPNSGYLTPCNAVNACPDEGHYVDMNGTDNTATCERLDHTHA